MPGLAMLCYQDISGRKDKPWQALGLGLGQGMSGHCESAEFVLSRCESLPIPSSFPISNLSCFWPMVPCCPTLAATT